MYISKLELFGFKSFPQKTLLDFDRGITSIVGPNGCGKTNVVDAIRWVMGEQRSTLLRSGKMTDVIFAGSKTRKQLNYAEVALTIHNNEGVLSVAYKDVVVARRLYRDGTSEYLLNGVPVRLKDINDLFVDTGMSTNAYSVIELKMVEEILSEDKNHRKLLFEEAAGINKYKSQRKSSHRKLDSTREDLARLEDIVYEIEKNIRSLKRQLSRYEKYEKYSEELKNIEIQFAQVRYEKLEKRIKPLAKQLTDNQVKKEDTGKQLTIDEAMLDRYREDINEIEVKLSEITISINELKDNISDNQSQHLVWNEKLQNTKSNIERLETEKKNAESRIKSNESIRDELGNQLNKNDPQIELLKKEYENKKKRYSEIENEFQKIDNRLKSIQDKKFNNNRDASNLEQKKNRLSDQKDNYLQLSAEQEKQKNELNVNVEQSKKDKIIITKEKIEIDKEIEKIEKNKNSIDDKKNVTAEKIDEEKENIHKLNSQLDKNRNELDFLNGLVENYSGYSAGVKYAIREIKHPNILGTISDLIEVDKQYSTAIEIGMENITGYLVTKTKESALEIIADINTKKAGRITIIPIDTVKAFAQKFEKYDKKDENIIGYAKDFIDVSKDAQVVVDYFLNDLLIVKSLKDIPSKLLKANKFCFVTADGDYINKSGIIKGGRGSKFQNLVGRKERIKELGTIIKKIQQELSAKENNLNNNQEKLSKNKKDFENINIELKNILVSQSEINKRLDKTEFSIEQFNKSYENINQSIATYGYKIQDIEKALKDLVLENKKIESTIAETEKNFDEAKKKYEEINEVKDKFFQETQETRIKLITIEREKETTNYRYQNAIETIEELSNRMEIIIKELESSKEIILEGEEKQKELVMDLEKLTDNLNVFKNDETEINKKYHDKRQQIYKVESAIAEKHKNQENVFQSLRDIEIELNEMENERKLLVERIQDRYRIDILKREFIPAELTEVEMRVKIEKLKNQIDLIGPINMAIKTEYEEESTRLKFIQEQMEDLLEAEKSVLETIEKLDKEARDKFTKTFSQIKQNFAKTYEMFFPNGNCDLKLIGNDDPLEADVEILSRPKGKAMKSIRALSGGEKALTAISLLFAIYLVKPSPYCILDEIDAPLDDNNIIKFTKALSNFTDKTQFIIITHNKITMKVANTLYGVTMQEEGVSKIVSVRFDGKNKKMKL
ncbi:MAG: chromosome segregation protein SMC [Candidatus Marinimicrobia bacterium]|nr:chromosome segregation protein SMC [Candidatus Neomarinimicrobiota bacterium]